MPDFDRFSPYNDLPLLPPNIEEIETKKVLKKAIDANRALANLRGVAARIPNQHMLIQSVILQEAKLSSEIENIVTTHDELYRAASNPEMNTDPQTKEVLRYRQALYTGFEALKSRPLTTNLFIDIVQTIKAVALGIRKTPGTMLKNTIGEVIYTPPEGEQIIRDKLSNLEKFIYEDKDELDPLVKMAIMHYQFEAIHPFEDGNGRTGRILNILYLVEKKLLDLPVLFLSRYIIENKLNYYKCLKEVTENQKWEEWILFMLSAIEKTAQQTLDQVERILNLMKAVQNKVQAQHPDIYSKDLIEIIFSHPYTKIQFLVDAKIAQRQTASSYLKKLADLGILEAHKFGREIYYVNHALLQELKY